MDKGVYQLWTLPLTGELKPIQVATTGNLASAVFSPDGRWVAYASSESGKAEIYLTPFNRGTGKWQVSRDGGTNPVWVSGTNEIFFLAADNTLTTVSVKEDAGSLKIGVPNRLFRIPGAGYFDVPARAQKILVGISGVPKTRPVHLVVNWAAELK
jgi:serine/threonine-protein kinase